MNVRHGLPDDLSHLYEICHRTGYVGQDATGVVSDRRLLGQYFAAPYLVHDPSWCWIATDDQGPTGYLVTTPDSRTFADWMNTQWLPKVREDLPQRPDPSWSPFETWLWGLVREPAGFPDFVDDYPAHLHIDFLPRAQGQGLGTRLIGQFIDQSRKLGVRGFHLGVGLENTRAQEFYDKQGFQVIRKDPGVLYLGLRL